MILPRPRGCWSRRGIPMAWTSEWLVPFPPYYDYGERILTDLRTVGIRQLQTLEGPLYSAPRRPGWQKLRATAPSC